MDQQMASNENTPGAGSAQSGQPPAWANGLKQLYDDVVDEPLPDAFKDLLAQLDSDGEDSDAPEGRQ